MCTYRRKRRIPSQYQHQELQPREPMFTVMSPLYNERSIYDELIDLDKETGGVTNGAYSQPDDVPVRPASNIYQGLDEPTNDDTYTKPGVVPAVPAASKVYQQLDAPAATSTKDSELGNDMYIHPNNEQLDEPTVTPVRNEDASQIDDTYMYPNSESPDVQTVTPIRNSVNEEASQIDDTYIHPNSEHLPMVTRV